MIDLGTTWAAHLTSWVVRLMILAQPNAPWSATYESTAAAIASAAIESPLYEGAAGAARTAALLTSVAWFESRFQPDAAGDMRGAGAARHATSFCAMQVSESNFPYLGVTREEIQGSIGVCVRSALRLMRLSFSVCRAEEPDHRLDNYAAGGDGCRRPTRDEGVHRIKKAKWLFAHETPPDPTNEHVWLEVSR